jgi:hypothetical protein
MNRRSLKLFALLSVATLPFGTVACSKSSPTEPAFDEQALLAPVNADSSASATVSDSAADDGSDLTSLTDERRGRGRGGRNSDDQGGGRGGRRGRGADDQAGDDRGRGGRGGRGGQDDNGNNPNNPARQGQEFEGSVARVGQNAIFLTGGTRILVNGQTQWIARGDLHNLSQVAGAVRAGRPTRVEGRGTRRADGAFVAATIKAETDD